MKEPKEHSLTPRALQLIALAESFSKECGHSYIGTEHILVSLLSSSTFPCVDIMSRFGVDVEKLRAFAVKDIKGETLQRTGRDPEMAEIADLLRTVLEKIDRK